jgi:CRISPR-associated endonuclease/helicase Cas3
VGKAYAPFQALLGKLDGGELLAKSTSNEKCDRPADLRPYFRHELASSLAFLQQHDNEPNADLIAFLIAAHHGKVRMAIRSLPTEYATPPLLIARGVQDNDYIPSVQCGDERSEEVTLSLSLMEMGTDSEGRFSWAARTQRLLRTHGPFRLAYMEALVRMADWRASRRERGDSVYD